VSQNQCDFSDAKETTTMPRLVMPRQHFLVLSQKAQSIIGHAWNENCCGRTAWYDDSDCGCSKNSKPVVLLVCLAMSQRFIANAPFRDKCLCVHYHKSEATPAQVTRQLTEVNARGEEGWH
jgi:hypothetical protein